MGGSAGSISIRGAGQVLARGVGQGRITQGQANSFANRLERGIERGGVTSGREAIRLARQRVGRG